nr:PPC domain-containing DNA-binding protein [Dissulfurirhabdus thermomarina]
MRLEDGDEIPGCIEAFAAERKLSAACCLLVGGAAGGTLVVGPADGSLRPPVPVRAAVEGVHEVVAAGTLFPGEDGRPRLHVHGALGRGDRARVGCLREGVRVWTVAEVVLLELLDTGMVRRRDPATGLELLLPG